MRKQVQLVIIVLLCFSIAGSSKEVSLQEVMNAGLPVLVVTTVNGEEPTYDRADPPIDCFGLSITNATKVPARMTISVEGKVVYDSGDYEEDLSGLTIKVRGNTTAFHSKKPYKLKLQKKADLLCRGDDKFKDKEWALIKDERLYAKAGLKVNELAGLQWTPAYKYVNLVFNGDYRGVYMLIETAERNVKCRLNVAETGYVFEYDPYWWKEETYVPSTLYYSMQYTYKYPDSKKVNEERQNYLKVVVSQFESSLKNGTYTNYVDVNSFATWLLCHDMLGCIDGAGSNMFLTKYDNTTETKIKMANLWDFDSAFNQDASKQWDSVHNRWFFELLFNSVNKSFVCAYKKRWEDLKSTIFNQIDTYFADYANSQESEALEKSLILDGNRWGIEPLSVKSNINYIRQWFTSRKVWLDENIHQLIPYEIPFNRLGDVNDDGECDERDITAIVSHIMGETLDGDDFNKYAADVNCDGGVNVDDVVLFVNQFCNIPGK